MNANDLSIEAKCENLMNIVVESRKTFGKMCVDYEQKTLLMENKILNLNIETFSNYRFKPKHLGVEISADDSKDMEDFAVELLERHKRIENLKNKLKNTQNVVLQLKRDTIGKKLREPLNAETMLAQAKEGKLT